MTVRVPMVLLGASIFLCGCHERFSIGPGDNSTTASAASSAPRLPAGSLAIHVHEVETSDTGLEYKWSIDGIGAANGSNTTTTQTTNMEPICLAVIPADSEKFHCEITVRAEVGAAGKINYSERTLMAIGNKTQTQSTEWTKPGQLATSFKTLVKQDAKYELPKQIVLATAAGKPVSIRVGD